MGVLMLDTEHYLPECILVIPRTGRAEQLYVELLLNREGGPATRDFQHPRPNGTVSDQVAGNFTDDPGFLVVRLDTVVTRVSTMLRDHPLDGAFYGDKAGQPVEGPTGQLLFAGILVLPSPEAEGVEDVAVPSRLDAFLRWPVRDQLARSLIRTIPAPAVPTAYNHCI